MKTTIASLVVTGIIIAVWMFLKMHETPASDSPVSLIDEPNLENEIRDIVSGKLVLVTPDTGAFANQTIIAPPDKLISYYNTNNNKTLEILRSIICLEKIELAVNAAAYLKYLQGDPVIGVVYLNLLNGINNDKTSENNLRSIICSIPN